MLTLNYRLSRLVVVFSVLLSAVAVLAPSFSKPADAAARTKFTICHRTNAITNPYRRITVAWNSVNKDGGGHDNDSHSGIPFNVAAPEATHGQVPRTGTATNNKPWGDIFYAEKNPGQWNARNWFSNDSNKNSGANTAGRAIFNGATFILNGVTRQACKTMTPQEFITSEIAAVQEIENTKPAGERRSTQQLIGQVMSDLDQMEAAEDVVLKEQLGGSFSTWYQSCTTNCNDVTALTSAISALPTPSVTTSSPTITSSTQATLNGTISPLGEDMYWYFEFSTDDEFLDSSISDYPATPSGPTSISDSVSTPVTGLTAGTTYYYRTVGFIRTGIDDDQVESFYYGSIQSFRTSNPSVATVAASSIAQTTAVLNGTGTTNGADSTVTFTWGTRSDLTGGDTQTGVAATPGTLADRKTNEPFSLNLTGLTGGTTYYFRAHITNANGSAVGAILQFTTVGPPSVNTVAASLVTTTSATLNGIGTAAGAISTVSFTWGRTSDLSGVDTVTGAVPEPSSLSASEANVPFVLNLTGLTPQTTYHFQAKITNANGDDEGSILSFTTPAVPPAVTTVAATSITETTATINGTGTTNGADSTVTFTWGTRSDLIGGDTQTGVAATPGSLTDPKTNEPFSLNLTGLTGGTRYYFRAVIANTNGTRPGLILNFTTSSPVNQNQVTPPEVTTEPATSVTGTTATINGTGTSNGATSTVTFTWGTSPTLASNNTTVNATPSSLDQNASGTAVSAALTGLTPGTTYYFRTSITNTNGSADGIIREFTTPAAATVTPAATSNDPLGRVIGTAWFDINRNNRRDAGEPLLPGVDVQLTPTGVTGQSAGTVRKTNFVMKTNIDGAFDFSQLPPGTYLITSVLPAEFGIQESWDSTGDNDWKATVTVVALQTSRGDFAAIGAAQADGTVEGGGGGSLDATWTGFDQKDDTNDDVTFTTKLATDGDFTLTGLPTGKYTVRATSKSGRTLVAPSTLRVTSKGATLTLNGITMNVKIVGFLPQTGVMNMFLPFGFATMLLPAGVAVRVATRRRRLSRL